MGIPRLFHGLGARAGSRRGPYVRDHGVAFHGDNGILVIDRGGWEVFPETVTDASQGRKKIQDGRRAPQRLGLDTHLAHVENFLVCMARVKRLARTSRSATTR